jgi:hypothetical protein
MKTRVSLLALTVASTLSLGAQAATYKVTEVADGGTITGKVTFSGEDPAPTAYAITKDNDVCGTGERLIDYVQVNDGALTNVVVYLDKMKEGKEFDTSITTGTLDQEGCEFHPFLQAIRNGAELKAINDDPVLHNIHTYEIIGRAKKTVFNVSQPNKGDTYTKAIKLKRGTAMKIECDAHDFMHSADARPQHSRNARHLRRIREIVFA